MAEPYTATIGTSWTAVAGEGMATVTVNTGSGTLTWCVTAGEPDATLIGGEFDRSGPSDKPFGNIPAGSMLRLRSSGEHVVTVHPDVRPVPVPAR